MSLFGPPDVAKLETKQDVSGLIRALGYQKDPGLSAAASAALVRIGTPAIELLIKTLKDRNEIERKAAVEVLVQIGSPALNPLVAASRDKKWLGRSLAVRTFGRIRNPETTKYLLMALNDPDEKIREAAVETLVQIGAPVVKDLISALRTEGRIRFVAAHALGQIGAPALDPLFLALDNQNKAIRGAAAGAFRGLRDPQAIEPLVTALTSQSWLARQAAAEGLAALYRSGQLNETQKGQLLAQGAIIRTAHQDQGSSSQSSSDCSGHFDNHTDKGIGVPFPTS